MPSNLQNQINKINLSLKTNLRYAEAILNHTNIGPVLPDGYTMVEYIQANSNAYINTNFKPTSNIRFDGKFYMGGTPTSYPTIFGCRGAYNSSKGGYPGFYSHNTSSGLSFHWEYQGITNTAGAQHSKIIYCNNLTNLTSVDVYDENMNLLGSSRTYSLPTEYTFTQNMFLFALNNNGSYDSSTYCSGYRLYYLKFLANDGETPQRYYIPCINPSNVVGVWDDVTKTFLTSANSNTFTAGPVI